jgi:serine/threonine-protein kinase
MVAGRKPFEGETVSDVIAEILKSEPPPLKEVLPELPSELQRIVSKALAKERGGRYQAIKDLELDLLSLMRKLDFKAAQLVDKIQAARRKLTIGLWREL